MRHLWLCNDTGATIRRLRISRLRCPGVQTAEGAHPGIALAVAYIPGAEGLCPSLPLLELGLKAITDRGRSIPRVAVHKGR